MARPKSYDGKELRALYMKGLSDGEIAERLSISLKTVANWRYESKVPPNRPRTLPTPPPAQPPAETLAAQEQPKEVCAAPETLPDSPTTAADEPAAEQSPVPDVVDAAAAAFSDAVADAVKTALAQEAEPMQRPADNKQPMTVAQLAEAFSRLAQFAPDVPVLLRSGEQETAASALRVTIIYHNAPGEQVAACIS